VHQYCYVEKDPQDWQASMCHLMMMQQQHLELLPAIGDLKLPMCFTKQHYITRGIGFGQDRTSGPSHIKMVVSRFITSLHKSRTFKLWVILGIDSSATIFVSHLATLVCICVRKCPIIGRFSTSYIGSMPIDLGLDRKISYSNQFMCPLLSTAMD
jgi:hypothetical protein